MRSYYETPDPAIPGITNVMTSGGKLIGTIQKKDSGFLARTYRGYIRMFNFEPAARGWIYASRNRKSKVRNEYS